DFELVQADEYNLNISFNTRTTSIFYQALQELYAMNAKWFSNRQLVRTGERDFTQVDARLALNRIVNRNDPFDIQFEESSNPSHINQELRTEMLNFIFASDDFNEDHENKL